MTTVPDAQNSTGTASAVLFLIFNRPDTTARVFEAIRAARPARLYVAADGPRPSRVNEAAACAETRSIVGKIDWPCELHTLFREQNLGCKVAVSGAISWFFEHEAEGIILEDDCLPSESFFQFCDELLQRYRDDTRVWQICGTRFVSEADPPNDSYLFSRFGPCWGWASWRRAWRAQDTDLTNWALMRQPRNLTLAYPNSRERKARRIMGDKLASDQRNIWDFQWGFTKTYQNGASIVPARNLIRNIGFGADATHTRNVNPFAPGEAKTLNFPLVHPRFFLIDHQHDRIYQNSFVTRTLGVYLKLISARIVSSIKRMFTWHR